MQKVVMAIWMVVVAMGMFNSCTKFEMEDPGQTTSWAAPKKLEQKAGKTVWEELSEKFSFFAKFEKGNSTLYETSYERPFGAYGEATHVVSVEAESELSGVKYAEGKLDTQKSEWDAKNGWWGTQVTRTQAFRLENAKYGADYSDSWYSTNAFFQKDTLKAEFPDAIWNRSVKLDSTDVYNKSIDGSKAYYKVRDYVATVTNVASIKDGFVKDAQKASKTFTMKDTLSLRFYVAPDPEDEFVRRWNEVQLNKEDSKIVGVWTVKEEWTISGVREVYSKAVDFTAWAKGYDGEPVYPTNTAYQTTTEKWNGTGNKALAATATNGIAADKFNSNFEVYGDKDVTLTYEDQAVTFKANLVHEAVKQSIGAAQLTLVNGTYYNISPYKAEIFPVYTVTCGEKSAKLELNAVSNCQLRVKANANVVIENQRFVANFKAEGEKLYHEDGQYANLWDEVEYTETVETDRKSVVRPLSLSGNVNSVDSYEVEDASMLGQLKLSSIKGNANSTSKKEGNFVVKTVAATVTATFDNKKVQTIDFTVKSETAEGMSLGYAAIDFDKISCKIDTVRVSEGKMKISPKYTVPVVITQLDGKAETKSYVVCSPFYETATMVETKVENKRYEALFETSGANLTTKVNANSWDVVTYTDGVETGRETETHNLTVKANINGGQPFAVDKEGLTKEYKITSVTRTGNQVTTVNEDGVRKERTIQNFNATVNNGQTLKIEVTTEKDLTEGMTLSHTYCETVKAAGVEASVSGNTVTLTPKVNVMLVEDNGVATKAATGEAKPYTIETSMVGTYVPETVREYEPKVEGGQPVVYVYDVTDGVKVQVRRDPFTPSATLKAQAGTDVYAANNAFNTVYNGERNSSTSSSSSSYWTVSNKKGQITSTMSNGAKSETNVADFGFDQAITYKDGNYTYTFNGSMAVSNSTDAITAAGNKTVNGIAYEASNYQENFYGVYSIDGTVVANLSDAVKRQILVEKEAEDIVPGTIKWIAFRAVAAIPDGNGGYKNADGHMQRIKGVAVGTEEGKVCYIPFADASDSNVMLPTATAFANANWCKASYYDASYVAGYDKAKNGVWYPAQVEDRDNQILYKDNGQAVRSLTDKSMNTWGWSNHTSVVDGYTISDVKGGVVTITFNGQTRVIK
ncbi:MAG: hypothetical protein IJ830_03885 [Alphaproteobacteria bacterium]|nr:hypothetical protein [Alphaproteobacteria bacterium]